MRQKTIAIIQPVYLPWLGYFEQIERADHFVVYDDVQYTPQDWRNRNRILSVNGPIWLTVPVRKSGLSAKINEVEIDNTHYWASKHLKSITFNYERAPHYDRYYTMLRAILEQKWEKLVDLDLALIQAICDELQITTSVSLSSGAVTDLKLVNMPKESNVDPVILRRNLRLIDLCRHHEASVFYVGARARDYLDGDLFREFGIEPVFQSYDHPVYSQRTTQFHSHMSVIDLLMNTGPAAREIMFSPARTGV